MASTTAPRSFASSRLRRADERSGRLLHLVAGLTKPEARTEAARALALHAGAEHLIIFLRDPELGIPLPAPGFPKTLPQIARWQAFLSACEDYASHDDALPFPDAVSETNALGVAAEGGAVVVLLGGEPSLDAAVDIALLLPLIAAALRGERTAELARAQARLAEQAANEANLLAASLDRARDELRHALAEANRAHAAKDRFIAVLSHELRTPLNPVLMIASALENDERLSTETRNDVALIRRNIELEANLIDDLLDLTRIKNSRIELRRRAVDAHQLLTESMTMVLADPAATCSDIRLELEAPAHYIHADSARIQQVFWNLLRNAAKFTPRDGHITVTTDNPTPERFRLRIRDTGIGIAGDDLLKIFDAFTQAHPGSAQSFGGLGLGLAISQALTHLHDGRLWAESAGTNQGATFYLELAVASEAPSTSGGTSPAVAMPTTPGRILLVEDHAATAEVMRRLLDRRGHEVRLAMNFAQARAALESEQFDILVSDLGLPDGSGYEVMEAARKLHPQIVGVAVSGYGMDADLAQSARTGFTHHLTKPIDTRRLYEVIEKALARDTEPDRQT